MASASSLCHAVGTASLFTLLVMAGCAPAGPPGPTATLPPDAVQGAGDPTRAAIIGAAYVFGSPGSVAGRPAEAARAVAQYEYLAVEIPTGARWVGFSPLVGTELVRGREEVRGAIGISPAAPPQAVIDALYTASRALRAGDGAAAERILAAPLFQPGGSATLQRLAALPLVPRANVATSLAASELDRQDRQDGRGRGGGGSGGGRS